MSHAGRNLDQALDVYRKQVLHWNRRINLVSRQDTAARLDTLIRQCRNSWDGLVAAAGVDLRGARQLWYFDLGSGGGLPGVVWQAQMAAAELPVQTLLVEPRDKRAWFLERVARETYAGSSGPAGPMQVAANRWGEIESGVCEGFLAGPHPSHILISLKALRLSDKQVLAGLAPFLAKGSQGDISLLIVRFHPPDQEWTGDLAADLGIPEAGHNQAVSSLQFHSQGGGVLAPSTLPGAGLVLSEYRIKIP
jgi:hypothetical protein